MEEALIIFLLLASAPLADSSNKIRLPGASGSGPYQVVKDWANAFSALYPEADITFTSVGSGEAQSALWGDIDCENNPVKAVCNDKGVALSSTLWGIGDAPFTENVYQDHTALSLQQYPACASAVVVTHSRDVTGSFASLEGEEAPALRLTFAAIAGIFNSSISRWDDPVISSLNPSLNLPDRAISVVVRADSSGGSNLFSEALEYNFPEWPKAAVGKLPQWPLGELAALGDYAAPKCDYVATTCIESCDAAALATNGTFSQRPLHFEAMGTRQLALGVLRTPYSVGYMGLDGYSEVDGFLAQAHISSKQHPSTFVAATTDLIRETMDALLDPVTLESDLLRTSDGFPISGYAYWYLKQNHTEYQSCYQAWLLCKFVEWSYMDPQARIIAMTHSWVTPPKSVIDQGMERLAQVQCIDDETGSPISALDYVPEAYRVDKNHIDQTRPIAWTLASIIVVTSLCFIAWVAIERKQRVVRASQPGFLILICVGTLAMGSAIFPIGIDDSIASTRGCDIACMSWIWLIPCGFSLSFSALFSKIWRLNILVRNSKSFRKVVVKGRDVLVPLGISFSLNVSLLLSWTLVDPLKWKRIKTDSSNSYGICQADGDTWRVFMILIVGVNACALLLANVEAYKARNISDEMSESSYIGFAMVFMLQAFLLGLPLAILVKDNPPARLFTYSGIIFLTCMSLLLLIFVPKVLFVRRDRRQGTPTIGRCFTSSNISGRDFDTGDANRQKREVRFNTVDTSITTQYPTIPNSVCEEVKSPFMSLVESNDALESSIPAATGRRVDYAARILEGDHDCTDDLGATESQISEDTD